MATVADIAHGKMIIKLKILQHQTLYFYPMNKNIIELNEETFDSQVLGSKIPVWVTYGATWCPPCKAFQPVHESVAEQYTGKVASFHVDVDDAPKLAERAGITSVPTHVCYKDGVGVNRKMGALSKKSTEEIYQSLIS